MKFDYVHILFNNAPNGRRDFQMPVIRKATMAETRDIVRFAFDVMKEATFGQVKLSREKAFQFANEFLQSGGFYLVYTEHQKIQGWVGLGTTFDTYQDKQTGFLYEIYVLPAYRKRGIAKKLCQEAIQHLEKYGYRTIELNVFAGNEKARNLCKSLGFTEVSTILKRETPL